MPKRSALVIATLAFLFCARAQTPEPHDVFEVASIKPSPPRTPGGLMTFGRVGGPGTTDPGQIRYLNLNLAGLINVAYGGGEIRKIIGADEASETTFDITAKLPPNSTEAQLRHMLQNLLADRFALTVHREQREMPVIALVVAKDGPKLTPAPETESAPISGELPTVFSRTVQRVDGDGYPLPPPPNIKQGTIHVNGKIRLTAREKTLSEFAGALSAQVRDIVVDRTGLTGKYDCSIVWATTDGPTIYDAVKQLGLRLQPEKLPIGVLVVDHANKQPTEN